MISQQQERFRGKVLIISYYFPPQGGMGCLRTTKFVKYLPLYHWKPLVLTVKDWVPELRDDSLCSEIPASAEVFRTSSVEIVKFQRWLRSLIKGTEADKGRGEIEEYKESVWGRWLKNSVQAGIFPDLEIGWFPFAVFKGLSIIRNENPDVIFSSSNPPTTHLIGYALRRITKKPWVVEFRDLWTQGLFTGYSFRWRDHVETRMESQIVHMADRILTTTGPSASMLSRKYPSVTSKIQVITNGYDAEDFNESVQQPCRSARFQIIYTGTFYAKRTPAFFLKALAELVKEHLEVSKEIGVTFIGSFGADNCRLLRELALERIVSLEDYLPHRKCIRLLQEASLLLLIVYKGGKAEGVLTGKIFEYIASGRPILALVPPGAAAKLIQRTKTGTVVDPEDVGKIKSAIYESYLKFKESQLNFQPNYSIIQQYEKRHQVEELAEIFDELLPN